LLVNGKLTVQDFETAALYILRANIENAEPFGELFEEITRHLTASQLDAIKRRAKRKENGLLIMD